MLGAWFVVSFVPVLFLEHTSNAYHLLALTALALFTARALPGFVHDELLPAVAQLRGKAPAGADFIARCILVAIFLALVLVQVTMLMRTFNWRIPRFTSGSRMAARWSLA